MALIEWTDDFSVRIKEIDVQHKKLVEVINTLHQSMLDGKGDKIISDILNELANYTVYHFQTEEKYFDQFNFKDTLSHKKKHSTFVNKVSTFIEEFESGDVMLTIDILDFLSDWIQNHILGEDMEYSDFLVEKMGGN